MEWQPIKTAPKDGTHIILFEDNVMIIGFFCNFYNRWETVGYHGPGDCGSDLENPTHWMSLPTPPEATL